MTVDELGTYVPVPAWPTRIVSLVPNLSELLWYVGAAERVVGVTDYCAAPPHGFPRARRVRGTKNPAVAAVVALEPDLVVANAEENRALDVERLRAHGLAVYVTNPRSITEAAVTTAEVAGLVGAAGPGRAVAAAIHRACDAAAARRPARPVRAACAIWRDPWMTVGADTFAGDLLTHGGFTLVPDEPRYPTVELSQLRREDPDVVLLPDEPYAFGERDRAVFDGWRARTRRIDGTSLTWYGPRTPDALRELTRLARGLARRR